MTCHARNLDTCKIIGSHDGPVVDLALSVDRQFLFSADRSTRKVWDLTRPQSRRKVPTVGGTPIAIRLSEDGARLAAASWEYPEKQSRISIWDTETNSLVSEFNLPPQTTTLEFSPDHSKLAGFSEEGSLWVVESESRSGHAIRKQTPERIRCLAFSASGNQLAAFTDAISPPTDSAKNAMSGLEIYDLESGTATAVRTDQQVCDLTFVGATPTIALIGRATPTDAKTAPD